MPSPSLQQAMRQCCEGEVLIREWGTYVIISVLSLRLSLSLSLWIGTSFLFSLVRLTYYCFPPTLPDTLLPAHTAT